MMLAKKLKNAPLKEAIFELFWQLPLDPTNFPTDPDFSLAVGKFQDLIKDAYPVYKSLDIPGNAVRIYPKPSYQFRKGELEWPVVQLGQGILTVNDTDKNYIWEDNYRPNIVKAIDVLLKSYEHQPKFNRVKLTYIDAAEYDPQLQAPSEFIAENLLTSIKTSYEFPGKENSVWINKSFHSDDIGSFQINIQNGINNADGKPSIIWTTAVEESKNFTREEVLAWLDKAHTITSSFFVKMLNPKFYESFNR